MMEIIEKRIAELYGTKTAYCVKKGISPQSLDSKLNSFRNQQRSMNEYFYDLDLVITATVEKRVTNETRKDVYFGYVVRNIYDDLCIKEKNSICICLKEIKSDYCTNIKANISWLKFCIVEYFGIEYQNGRYNKFCNEFTGITKERKGSFFYLTKEMLASHLEINRNN